MLIKTIPVGQLETNCYIVTDEATLECAVIDPGDESNAILDYLEDNHLRCRAILLTHGHYDHVGAVEAVAEETGATVYLNREDDRKTRALSVGGESFKRVPLLGKVTAGMPITAVENIEGYVPFEAPTTNDSYFALNVSGDSMINAGIFDGDVIIVHCQPSAESGDIVVALLGDEATVKRLKLDEEARTVTLMPENPAYAPIPADDCLILGKVCALIRRYE